MIFNIAIERGVQINPNLIINSWNDTDEYKKIAKIELEKNTIDKQSDVFSGDTILVIISIATGVTANFIYDAIKNIISNLGFQIKDENNHETNIRISNEVLYIRKTEIEETVIISRTKK